MNKLIFTPKRPQGFSGCGGTFLFKFCNVVNVQAFITAVSMLYMLSFCCQIMLWLLQDLNHQQHTSYNNRQQVSAHLTLVLWGESAIHLFLSMFVYYIFVCSQQALFFFWQCLKIVRLWFCSRWRISPTMPPTSPVFYIHNDFVVNMNGAAWWHSR